MVSSGPNSLGKIPLAWFMPGGERDGGLTAIPPLLDLAELNRVYWAASADHDGRLMPFVRSPAAFGRCLGFPEDKKIPFSPGKMILSDNPNAMIDSIGVDTASAVNSQADLREKREAMRDWGLQTVQSGVTATMSENVATNASSSLKGWVADFKDCLENALRNAALFQGWTDGPAIVINTEFKNSLDLNVLGHLQQAVTSKIIKPDYYVFILLSMIANSDEFAVDDVLNPDFGKEEDYGSALFNDYGGNKKDNPSDEGEKKQPAG
jgi:hypothetical protein